MKTSNFYISATEARNNFFELLKKVKKEPYPINITIKGIPEAVLMSKEEFDGLIATIETLSDSKLTKAIRKGDEDIKAGRYRSWEEVKKELDLGSDYLVADKSKKNYVPHRNLKTSRKRSKKIR